MCERVQEYDRGCVRGYDRTCGNNGDGGIYLPVMHRTISTKPHSTAIYSTVRSNRIVDFPFQ